MALTSAGRPDLRLCVDADEEWERRIVSPRSGVDSPFSPERTTPDPDSRPSIVPESPSAALIKIPVEWTPDDPEYTLPSSSHAESKPLKPAAARRTLCTSSSDLDSDVMLRDDLSQISHWSAGTRRDSGLSQPMSRTRATLSETVAVIGSRSESRTSSQRISSGRSVQNGRVSNSNSLSSPSGSRPRRPGGSKLARTISNRFAALLNRSEDTFYNARKRSDSSAPSSLTSTERYYPAERKTVLQKRLDHSLEILELSRHQTRKLRADQRPAGDAPSPAPLRVQSAPLRIPNRIPRKAFLNWSGSSGRTKTARVGGTQPACASRGGQNEDSTSSRVEATVETYASNDSPAVGEEPQLCDIIELHELERDNYDDITGDDLSDDGSKRPRIWRDRAGQSEIEDDVSWSVLKLPEPKADAGLKKITAADNGEMEDWEQKPGRERSANGSTFDMVTAEEHVPIKWAILWVVLGWILAILGVALSYDTFEMQDPRVAGNPWWHCALTCTLVWSPFSSALFISHFYDLVMHRSGHHKNIKWFWLRLLASVPIGSVVLFTTWRIMAWNLSDATFVPFHGALSAIFALSTVNLWLRYGVVPKSYLTSLPDGQRATLKLNIKGAVYFNMIGFLGVCVLYWLLLVVYLQIPPDIPVLRAGCVVLFSLSRELVEILLVKMLLRWSDACLASSTMRSQALSVILHVTFITVVMDTSPFYSSVLVVITDALRNVSHLAVVTSKQEPIHPVYFPWVIPKRIRLRSLTHLAMGEVFEVLCPILYLISVVVVRLGPNSTIMGGVGAQFYHYFEPSSTVELLQKVAVFVVLDTVLLGLIYHYVAKKLHVNFLHVFAWCMDELGPTVCLTIAFVMVHQMCIIVLYCGMDFTFEFKDVRGDP